MSSHEQPFAQFDLTSGLRLGIGIVLPVFPWLVPAEWPGAPDYVCRPLVSDPLTPHIPLVTLAYISHELRTHVDRERLAKLNRTEAQVRNEAFANLRRLPALWRLQTLALDGDEQMTYAICDAHHLAAERVLDKTFLLEAAQLLGMPMQVAVGVPHHGMLVAAGVNNSPEALRSFKLTVERWYTEAGEQRISPLLFRMMFGNLMGVIYFDGQAVLSEISSAQR